MQVVRIETNEFSPVAEILGMFCNDRLSLLAGYWLLVLINLDHGENSVYFTDILLR